MIEWTRRETWVGVFDILGFKNMINQAEDEFHRIYLTSQIDDIFETLKSDIMKNGELEFLAFSDTFVLLTKDQELASYPWFLLQCTQLINRSIEVRLPVRGAIGVGIAYTSKEPTIVLGKPFVEAYEYCEDQDWIGLLMTPTVTRRLRTGGLEPLHHDFGSDAIPLKTLSGEDVLAYRFQNGSANYSCYLLPYLQEMHQLAPAGAKGKYQRTMDFIEKHYRYIDKEKSLAEP
jgi:hypothetical protein